jgi:type III pantothenate kinase
MILVLETGNTTVNIIVYDGSIIKYRWKVIDTEVDSVENFEAILSSLLSTFKLKSSDFEIVLISSVVRHLEKIQQEYCEKNGLKYFNIKGKNVKLTFKPRKNMGADLIANVFAGIEYYKENFIVVDMGTATTFSVVGKKGIHLGELFVAGVDKILKALSSCDLLPDINISEPKKVIGTTTDEAMLSGVYYGYIGMLKEIVRNIIEETGTEMKVILTGGYAALFIEKLDFVMKVEPNLAFDGVKMIYEFNK